MVPKLKFSNPNTSLRQVAEERGVTGTNALFALQLPVCGSVCVRRGESGGSVICAVQQKGSLGNHELGSDSLERKSEGQQHDGTRSQYFTFRHAHVCVLIFG